ncbi:MAG TPA: DUF6519 domain-containing protein [Sphingomicrobium sp.]|nr:DUF6519 domain-containing protein [Sphingomicrobium sp.]
MKGDFSKFDFESAAHYAAVLFQQGRVSLDSDFNDATAIVLRQLRLLTRDLYGAAGGPADGSGFALGVQQDENDWRLTIGAGHYYVDGILCENRQARHYSDQPYYVPVPADASGEGGDPLLRWLDEPEEDDRFWVYLDVWERHISWIEDDRIREPALGGSDTCTRVQIVWQVKALLWDDAWDQDGQDDSMRCASPLGSLPASTGLMAARVDPGAIVEDPCSIAPEARFRGSENQLYRIEIHRGGDGSQATFKWSRDNGSVVSRWLGINGNALIVSPARGFRAGAWVEVSHEALDLAGLPGELVRVVAVEGDLLTVEALPGIAWQPNLTNPSVRLWDQKGNDDMPLEDGALPVVESATGPAAEWIEIGDGIQVRFEPGGHYRPGDYWTIRGSAATGGIDWPIGAGDDPKERAPQGIEHHYAPLGILAVNNGEVSLTSCRRCLELPIVACRDVAPAVAPPPPPPPPPPPGPAPVAEPAPAPVPATPAPGRSPATPPRPPRTRPEAVQPQPPVPRPEEVVREPVRPARTTRRTTPRPPSRRPDG